MKLFLTLMVLAFLFCPSIKALEVTVNSSAKIYNSDINHTKIQALKNVLHAALKKTVSTLLDEKTINYNYEIIKNEIYRYNKKFIIDYLILSEKQDFINNLYKISITANVDEKKILQKIETLRILPKNWKNKRLLVVYHNKTDEAFPPENPAVKSALDAVQQAFTKQSFRTFSEQTLRQIKHSFEQEIIVGRPVDSLIALTLNYNADVLVIMGMNSVNRNNQQSTFYQTSIIVNFSIYDAISGEQIAETNVEASEFSLKQPGELKREQLLKIAGRHASLENVRRATEHINNFYKESGEMSYGFSVIFSGFSPNKENIIIEYLENNADFRQLSELKNTFGHLELELFATKRKSILRRQITSDLIELEIESTTKSIAGNNLFFINPNPMYEE